MQKILKETSLICAIQHIISNFKVVPEEVLAKLAWFSDLLTRFWLTPENVHSENEALEITIGAANCVLQHSMAKKSVKTAITTMVKVAELDYSSVPKMASH